MNKQQILDEIRRIASVSGGKVPGSQRFESETGLRKVDWYPRLWLRWGDAIREAGLEPNLLSAPFSKELLIEKYISLIRELGRFPIEGDLVRKRDDDKTFPNRGAFKSLGSKAQRAVYILEYCRARGDTDLQDVIDICGAAQDLTPPDAVDRLVGNHAMGYVYLVKHGARREYKIGKTFNPVRREGEVALQLPEKVAPVHYIKTDDPSGIERYWHTRFADKRKEGEWFALTADDVRAFKRWKRIY